MLSIGLAFALAVVVPPQQSDAPVSNAPITLQVSLATDRREFYIGETIPLRLAFSSAASTGCYEINMAQYDRSGRMNYEHFEVSPSGATVDPLDGKLFGIMGGLTGFKCLAAEPWTILLNL